MAVAEGKAGRASALDYLVLHGVVLVWGLTAVLGKLVTLTPVVLTGWRTGLAAVVLGGVVWWRGGRWPGRGAVLAMLGTGLLIGLHWTLFFLAARRGTVSGCLAGVATMALWVALLEPLMIRGKRWNMGEGLLAVGVAGGVMVIQFSDRGFLTGMMAAAVAAVFSIINGRLVRRHSALMITGLEMGGAFLFCVAAGGFLAPAGGTVWWPQTGDWVWVLVLALVCTVVAYSACVWVQRRVSVLSVAMAGNLEPIYGMVLAPLVFGAAERQGGRFYVGAAVIIGCVVAHTWMAGRRGRLRG